MGQEDESITVQTDLKSTQHDDNEVDDENLQLSQMNVTFDTINTADNQSDLNNSTADLLRKDRDFRRNSQKSNSQRMSLSLVSAEISAIEEETQCLRQRAIDAKRNQKKSIKDISIDLVKYTFSFALLIFCITMVMGCIFTKESEAAKYNIHPVAAFFLFWFLVLWLAFIEGSQGCIVGLQPVNPDKYEDSHMVTHMVTELAYKADNLERYIIGRQFLVVLVIFLINMCGSATKGADPFGLPKIWNDIFLENGIAMMLTTIMIGQLASQVNAAVCLLDFINNYWVLYTTHFSLWIEFSGLLHCVYIVQLLFSKIFGTDIETPTRKTGAKVFFWARVLLSTVILGFCFAVTIQAILDENSGMWKGVPVWASLVIFFTLMCLAGFMEGMQIAAFALMNVPEDELKKHPVAYTNCQLMFTGSNLQSFLIGRQIFVAALIFIVARIASISGPDDYSVFGASPSLQNFFNTGLLGSVVLTIVGSLIWRIIASSCPLPFMSNPIIYIIIRACLLLEGSGICSSSWGLAYLHKTFAGFQRDEVYLEATESQDDTV